MCHNTIGDDEKSRTTEFLTQREQHLQTKPYIVKESDISTASRSSKRTGAPRARPRWLSLSDRRSTAVNSADTRISVVNSADT
ncbi:hypothetical protein EYF80_032430 [Liparis tanakae]|uniref:Uncharacterized protein n=1 Tax=Liparis tanakae TaxID=230148 RepID=A0A4Z2GXM9_9TELE|nr:hypothetical protein EYF80_032430 [Liparis tanakae]